MRGVDSSLLDGGSHSSFRSYSPELNHHQADEENEPLHVFDLPQLYQKPSADNLLRALDLLAVTPPSFEAVSQSSHNTKRSVHPEGVTRYLTSIISSKLAWLEDDAAREQVWEAASERLSERSGRTAMPSMTRSFTFPTPKGAAISISIHEPSLTADNLGLKTWTSSYQLSKRLAMQLVPFPYPEDEAMRVLELGAGTGLVGLAFASTYTNSTHNHLHLHLTDLPPIVPNLAHNVQSNSHLPNPATTTISTGVLDWSTPPDPLPSDSEQYSIILAADPLYSPQHPPMLTRTISTYLRRNSNARAILEMPLRQGYLAEAHDFRCRMLEMDMVIIDEGEEVGYDDWGSGNSNGNVEVKCWWSIWGWESSLSRK